MMATAQDGSGRVSDTLGFAFVRWEDVETHRPSFFYSQCLERALVLAVKHCV